MTPIQGLSRLVPLVVLALLCAPTLAASRQQTIVFMRHGEKPDEGLGQIDCRGLNRSLALPRVLAERFGRPDYIFAPDPRQRVRDKGQHYNYIRPLATIEPSAIRFGRPVITTFGFRDVAGLRRELGRPRYRDALVFVAWEHHFLT